MNVESRTVVVSVLKNKKNKNKCVVALRCGAFNVSLPIP